jgi:acetylornithine deacetylase/succinyl-diaminopimelate desuccinylase-like protein
VATDVHHRVDADMVVDLARGICRIPSPLGGEKPLAVYIAGRLRELGFDVELQDVVQDRPNVVAIRRGNPAYQSVLFNGHLDIPEPFGEWSHDPYDPWIDNGLLYGGGLQDMKGGLAALIAGAAAAARLDPDLSGDVIVTAVMHHDTTGVGTKFFLEQNAWPIDAGVCGEPTDLKVQLFHGGAWAWEITTRGVPRHQSRLEEGVNAITGMMEILRRLTPDALTCEPDPRYSHLPRTVVGMIAGGAFTSMTAESCLARGDIRYLPTMTVDQMKADVRRIIADVCAAIPGLSAEVRTFAHQWPYQIAPSALVVQRLIAAHTEVTGTAPELTTGLPAGAFITDAADMVRHGIPTVVYGPGDWNTIPDESIPIRDLATAAKVYAQFGSDIVSRRR